METAASGGASDAEAQRRFVVDGQTILRLRGDFRRAKDPIVDGVALNENKAKGRIRDFRYIGEREDVPPTAVA